MFKSYEAENGSAIDHSTDGTIEKNWYSYL